MPNQESQNIFSNLVRNDFVLWIYDYIYSNFFIFKWFLKYRSLNFGQNVKILAKFSAIIRENFVSILPPPKKKKWNILYTALCIFYIFDEISIIPLEILSSAHLNYFNGGMLNCVCKLYD